MEFDKKLYVIKFKVDGMQEDLNAGEADDKFDDDEADDLDDQTKEANNGDTDMSKNRKPDKSSDGNEGSKNGGKDPAQSHRKEGQYLFGLVYLEKINGKACLLEKSGRWLAQTCLRIWKW